MAASEAVPGRAVLRGLGLGFAALAALLLVALLALWGLLATAFGRDLLLDRLLAGLPAERLQIGAREGSLAGGLRLHDVVYSDAQQRLSIDRLELRPAWPGLAPAELRLRLLRVQGLQQQRLDAPDAPQRSWAETLQALDAPFALRIEHLHIDTAFGHVSGRLSLAPKRRFASSAELDLVAHSGVQGRLSLQGDLDAGRADFVGHAEGPLRLTASWDEAVDASTNGWPLALSGRIERGGWTVELRESSHLRIGQGVLHAEPLALSLLGGQLELQGRYRLDDGAFDVQARAEGLAWGEAEARVRSSGQAHLQGRLEDWQAELALDLQRGAEQASLSGRARATPEALVLAPFRLLTPAGRLAGEARLDRDERGAFAVDARLQDFDPGWLLPAWPGRLAGRMHLQGVWPQAATPRYRLRLEALAGRLRGQAVAGDLRLDHHGEAQALDLDLRLGDGRLAVRGALAPRQDLDIEARALDLAPWVEGLQGLVEGRMSWRAGASRPAIGLDAVLREGRWNGLAVQHLALQGALPAQGEGAFVVQAQGLALPGLPQPLDAARLALQADWTARPASRHELALSGFELQATGWPELRLLAPARLLLEPSAWRLPTPACWQVGADGRLCAEGTNRDARLLGSGFDLAWLAPWWPANAGQAWRPAGRFDLQARRWIGPQGPGIELRLDAGLQPGGRVGAELAIDAEGALAGSAELRMDDLRLLELLSADLAAPRGRIEGRLVVAGHRDAPRWSGALVAAPLSVELPALGIAIHEGELRLAADEDGRLRLQGRLPSGDGALQIEGEWRDALRQGRLSVHGERVRVLDTAEGRVWISPALELALSAERLRLRGRVEVPQAELALERLGAAAGVSPDVVLLDAPPPATARPESLQTDLRFVFGDAVRLHGHGFEGRLTGELRVRDRPGREPRASGTLGLEGTLRAYGQNLALTRGNLRWANTALEAPLLDVRAERPDSEPRVGVLLSGHARAPTVELWSQPPMAQAEVLSWLMFGRPLAATDGRDAAQLEQAATALGGSALAQALAGEVGLDSASLGPARGLDGTVLTVGKRISPRLYLSYGMALSGTGQVLALTWSLRRWLAVRLEAGSEQRLELEATVERD